MNEKRFGKNKLFIDREVLRKLTEVGELDAVVGGHIMPMCESGSESSHCISVSGSCPHCISNVTQLLAKVAFLLFGFILQKTNLELDFDCSPG